MNISQLGIERGTEAFHAGIACAPALDPTTLDSITGCSHDETKAYLAAWLAGWTAANLDHNH